MNLSFNGINYTDHPNTISEHFRSQLGNINNNVFIVGGGYASTVNKQTEAGFINFGIFYENKLMKKPNSYSILE